MVVIRHPDQVASVADPFFRQLISGQMQVMADGEEFDPDIHGYFLLMEPGDSLAKLEQEVGPTDMVEVLEEHPTFYEAVFVPGCGDFGIVALIPKFIGLDPELLAFCEAHAVPAA